jgi:hypothetical protein
VLAWVYALAAMTGPHAFRSGCALPGLSVRPDTLVPNETGAANNPPTAACCEWPQSNHGITLDYKGNVWIGGNRAKDVQMLTFTQAGKFLRPRRFRCAYGKNQPDDTSLGRYNPGAARSAVSQSCALFRDCH